MPRSKPPRRKRTPHTPIVDPYREKLQSIVAGGRAFAEGAAKFCQMTLKDDDSQRTREMVAEAFLAGASSTFQLMVRMNDDTYSDDATDADFERMQKLHDEAMAIDRVIFTKYGNPAGSA